MSCRSSIWSLALLGTATLACSSETGEGGAFESNTGTATVTATATGTATESSGPDSAGSSSAGTTGQGTDSGNTTGQTSSAGTGGEKYDVGFGTGSITSDTSAEGCGAVDLLFVMDNSPSMKEYQVALASAFPGFIDAVVTSLPAGTDIHVGITTTSFGDGSCTALTPLCTYVDGLNDTAATHYILPGQNPNSENGYQGRLFEYDGKTYFEGNTADDPADLKAWFTGAAGAVGEMGCNYEYMSAAAAYSTDPANDATNAGFIRDEGAALVLFFLSDQIDNSQESANAYVQKISDAKAGCGGATCVVTAGILNPCVQSQGDLLWQVMTAFTAAPIWSDIEDTNGYADAVGNALATVVAEKCDEIPPVG